MDAITSAFWVVGADTVDKSVALRWRLKYLP